MDRRSFLKAFVVGTAVATDPFGIVGANAVTKKTTAKPTTTTKAPATSGPTATVASTTTAKPAAKRPAKIDKLRLAGGVFGFPAPFGYLRGPGLAHCLFMFDTLTWKDSSGDVIPWLASSWTSSPDGKTWQFTIRDGVRFHDGQPLTADDIVFTFDYFRTGPGKAAAGLVSLDVISKVTAVGARAVRFDLSEPYAPFAVLIAGRTPILPKHIWSSVTDPAKFRDKKALIGSGPYTADVIDDAKQTYRYEANPDFFLGMPVVGALEFTPTRDSLQSFDNGDLDVADVSFEEGIPDSVLAKYRKDRAFDLLSSPGEFGRSLHINMSKGAPFNNPDFRLALAYAIDRKEIVRRLLLGQGDVASLGGLSPSHEWLAPNLPTYDYDPQRAIALLEGIGLKSVNGTRFSTTLQTSLRDSPKTAELVKEYLRAVGINVTVNSLDPTSADDATAKGNYNLALVSYGGMGGDPDSLRTRMSSKVRSQSFTRVIGWSNARFDALADEQLSTVIPARRAEIVKGMQREIAKDLPLIGLYLPDRLFIFQPRKFNAWYYTPGGVFGGYPGVLNKHIFVTGKPRGF